MGFIRKYSALIAVMIFMIHINAQKNSYIVANVDYDNGNYQSALSNLDKYLASNSYNEDALFLRGKSKFKLFHYQSAIDDFKKLNIKKFPEANLFVARANSVLNQNDMAIISLKKYLKLKDKIPEERIVDFPEFENLSNDMQWENLWAVNWYSKKEKLLISAENKLIEGNYEEVETLVNEYVLKYKENPKAFLIKANLSILRNNDKEALHYIEKSLELESSVTTLIVKAETEYRLKKYSKSLRTYGEAYQIDSLDLKILFGRSLVYSSLKKHELAEMDIKNYLLYYPKSEKGLHRYAKICEASGDFLLAIQKYGKLIENYPAKTEYYKERANAYMATKTYTYAIKDYSMALDLYPRDAEIYFQKGNAYFKLNDVQKACLDWKRAKKYGSNETEKLIYKYCR